MTLRALLLILGPMVTLASLVVAGVQPVADGVISLTTHLFTEGLTVGGVPLPVEVQVVIVGLRILGVGTFVAFLAWAFIHLGKMFAGTSAQGK